MCNLQSLRRVCYVCISQCIRAVVSQKSALIGVNMANLCVGPLSSVRLCCELTASQLQFPESRYGSVH